ncbi:pyridoxal phosphate-dependent transferase [Thamnocephalis sphaerospora]|uniref:Selenocysteine lyase n=1 Tax=Thamnocephalis sphaerospora TaxID=78915 RepID=A0A4P9XJX6_9FUNG|nr:pyridoxal phosphate-dependent transferase [Thamnocephalis sphaerospora]|eukprot:RKP06093.1 pyridoxal phosphate-dependent transferase [Thamnocephalis sphaerospora]
MTSHTLYFDYNATTPVDSTVAAVITEALAEAWANPSSASPPGHKARATLEKARQQVAEVIHASPQDILFTSGGTESNYMVQHAVLCAFPGAHILLSDAEHPSVALPAEEAMIRGAATVVRAPLCASGEVDVAALAALLTPDTRLVSVMLVQNESGVVNDVAAVAAAVRAYARQHGTVILVHTDAAQAIGKIPVDVDALDVDYLTIVGHKFYGPRVGALYVRGLRAGQTPLSPLFLGGGQEGGYRAGTENTPMLAGLGEACQQTQTRLDADIQRMRMRIAQFEAALQHQAPDGYRVIIHGANTMRAPSTSLFSIVADASTDSSPVSSRELVARLAVRGIYVGAGSACHSSAAGADARPTVLRAMQVPAAVAHCTLRFSVGRYSRTKNLPQVVEAIWTEAVSSVSTSSV